jgi:hypothetical protein
MRQVTELMQGWLNAKEAERVEHRADETLKLSRRANVISIVALLISIISASTAIVLAVIR